MLFMGGFLVPLSSYAFELNSAGTGWEAGKATFHTTPLNSSGSGLSNAQSRNAFIEALAEWSDDTIFEYDTTTGSAVHALYRRQEIQRTTLMVLLSLPRTVVQILIIARP